MLDFTVRKYPDAVTICHIDQGVRIVTHDASDSIKSLDCPWVGRVAYVEHSNQLGSPTASLISDSIAN
jgi:hypothetical protein